MQAKVLMTKWLVRDRSLRQCRKGAKMKVPFSFPTNQCRMEKVRIRELCAVLRRRLPATPAITVHKSIQCFAVFLHIISNKNWHRNRNVSCAVRSFDWELRINVNTARWKFTTNAKTTFKNANVCRSRHNHLKTDKYKFRWRKQTGPVGCESVGCETRRIKRGPFNIRIRVSNICKRTFKKIYSLLVMSQRMQASKQ